MTSLSNYQEIRRQILAGRTSWGIIDYGGDADIFQTKCLTPLEQLCEVYGKLYMHYVYGGKKREQIVSVHIVDSVDHLAEEN
jgi:hypothetical protein